MFSVLSISLFVEKIKHEKVCEEFKRFLANIFSTVVTEV